MESGSAFWNKMQVSLLPWACIFIRGPTRSSGGNDLLEKSMRSSTQLSAHNAWLSLDTATVVGQLWQDLGWLSLPPSQSLCLWKWKSNQFSVDVNCVHSGSHSQKCFSHMESLNSLLKMKKAIAEHCLWVLLNFPSVQKTAVQLTHCWGPQAITLVRLELFYQSPASSYISIRWMEMSKNVFHVECLLGSLHG